MPSINGHGGAIMRQAGGLAKLAGILGLAVLAAGCGGASGAPAASSASAAGASASAAAKPATSSPGAAAAPAGGSAAAKPAGSSSAGASPAAGGLTRLNIPYTSPSGVYAPIWVGVDEGIFRKYGFDATTSYMDTNTVAPALISGEIDVSPTPSTLNIMLSGGDAIFIANVVTAPVFSLYSDAGIPSVEALKGQVIGNTPPGSAPDAALRALLDKHGLNPAADVKYITSPDPATILAAMNAKQAVAGILSAPSTLNAKKAGYKELANTGKEGVAGLHQVIAVKKSTLDQKRAAWLRLLQAYNETIDYIKSNPDKAKAVVGKYTKVEPGPALDEAYGAFAPYLQLGPVKTSDVAAVLRFSSNPAAASFDPNKAIDNSIIDALK
jgi:NitT/TauT family transport system substrate-binding protein